MSYEYRYDFFKEKLDKARKKIKTCKVCSGEGYLPTGKTLNDSSFEYKDCKCKKQYLNLKKFVIANIPKKQYNILSQKFKRQKVMNMQTNDKINLKKGVIDKYVNDFNKARKSGLGLILFGTHGSGKTTVALRVLVRLLDKKVDGYYTYFKDLIGLLLESYDDKEKSFLFKEIVKVDLLIIDELSLVGRVTPHMIAEFTSLCKQRFENQTPTILISNYETLDEIYHNFGAPMQSLLNEAFAGFRFYGRDLREDKYEYLRKFFE